VAAILVVEDEPNIAAIIRFKLEREGHRVRHETSGSAALEACAEQRPDLALLDSSLDDVDALQLLAQIRGSCPVVVMTEFRDERTPVRALEGGAVASLEKPFKPTQLARLVGSLV
jgi:DNA-binding response OmpR family regulator